ncbi:hypothetical protein HO173_000039 [Letharia columbiana]|uniref:Uncharacterized protein n=1 Tax=Letharia columbiana TaxID=112416 RepID=A0A8H6G6K9_9LECA|nr:uncharacterized protein HO173_000039 [Letharia columbiana]KAF6241329.1 hypothetical protein HO173_000039 [Letharia columbiana]
MIGLLGTLMQVKDLESLKIAQFSFLTSLLVLPRTHGQTRLDSWSRCRRGAMEGLYTFLSSPFPPTLYAKQSSSGILVKL